MLPGDRLLAVFTERRQAGERFSEWLPHVTIVPWFRADISDTDLAEQLSDELGGIPAFKAQIGPEEHFGSRGRKLVNLVCLPSPFEKIELIARRILKKRHAWLVDESTKSRNRFRPHVTVQKSGRLHEGDSIICDRVYLVVQEGGSKLIAKEVLLNGQNPA